MVRLQVYILGPFRVVLDGKQVEGFAMDKVRALLSYLAVESGKAHRRDALAALLWPDQPNSVARKNLRQALYTLRQALAEMALAPSPVPPSYFSSVSSSRRAPLPPLPPLPFLLVTPQTVQFNPGSDWRVDRTEFTQLLQECQSHPHQREDSCAECNAGLRAAGELYRGDFLEGFSLSDSEPFDEWLMVEREGLRQQVVSVFGRLAAYHETVGDTKMALQNARRQLELEPWGEDGHRRVMRLLAASGQCNAALAQYEACCKVMAREFGAAPEAETIELYEKIKAGELGVGAGSAGAMEAGTHQVGALQSVPAHNLPRQLTPFIGRERELADICEMLQDPDCRLLTLTGMGGAGKTRLALEVASRQIGTPRDGVFFVPLSAVRSPEYLVSSIASALGLSLQGQQKPRDQLLEHLREKEMLLVLDNLEHLLGRHAHSTLTAVTSDTAHTQHTADDAASDVEDSEGARPLVIDMLRGAPSIKIVATSREALGLQAEFRFSLAGLPFPDGSFSPELQAGRAGQDGKEEDPGELAVQGAGKFGAVQLLVERARRVDRSFALSPKTVKGVIRVCLATAGIPLAIELAAAWAGSYSMDEIASAIARNIDFVAADLLDLPSGHRSLRAVFNHSWTLLSAEQTEVFQKLSVFQGGWDLHAASQVLLASSATSRDTGGEPSGEEKGRIAATIALLAGKSLLVQTEQPWENKQTGESGGTGNTGEFGEPGEPGETEQGAEAASMRYNVHELLRQYAAERLAESPEQRRQVYNAHAQYYLYLAEAGDAELRGARSQEWLARLELEHNNLRSALDWACYEDEGKEADLDLALRLVKSLWWFWNFRGYIDEGRTHIKAALSLVEHSDIPITSFPPRTGKALVSSLLGGAALARYQGDYGAARPLLERALQTSEDFDDKEGIVRALNFAAVFADDDGDYSRADLLYARSLAITRELGDTHQLGLVLNNWANTARQQGDYVSARSRLEESLMLGRQSDNKYLTALSLLSFGFVLQYQGDYSGAEVAIKESLQLYLEVGNRSDIAACLDFLSRAEGLQSRVERAARLWGAAEALRRSIGYRVPPSDAAEYNRSVEAARQQAGDEAFAAAWQAGQAASLQESVALALS